MRTTPTLPPDSIREKKLNLKILELKRSLEMTWLLGQTDLKNSVLIGETYSTLA